MISELTTKIVWKRCWWKCEGCWIVLVKWVYAPNPHAIEKHHIYFLSQYKRDDRDQDRNVAMLCPKCHRDNIIWVHGGNSSLDRRLKREADIRKPLDKRSQVSVKKKPKKVSTVVVVKNVLPKRQNVNWKLTPAQKQIKKDRDNMMLEKYKESHDWLTPIQFRYKMWKDRKK